MKGEPSVLVVVPAYNEGSSVRAVVESLRADGFSVVVIDDGSVDDTASEAAAGGAAVVRLPVNLGVGGALRCGFRYAVEHGADLVVQCDADGQHPSGEIRRLVDAQAETGAHLVIGSRFAAEGGVSEMTLSRTRRFVMRVLARRASAAAGVRITDATSGFRCIAQPLLGQFARSFPVHYLGDTYEALVVAGRNGYRVREVGVAMRERVAGRSSARSLIAAALAIRAVTASLVRMDFRIAPCPPDEAGRPAPPGHPPPPTT